MLGADTEFTLWLVEAFTHRAGLLLVDYRGRLVSMLASQRGCGLAVSFSPSILYLDVSARPAI